MGRWGRFAPQREQVQAALDDPRPGIPHEEAMSEMKALIDSRLSTHPAD
ncbi:antitoxin PaaA2 family protein [Pseudomonas sp. S1_E04]